MIMRKEIEWMLFESGITSYQISKETGIAQYTLGKYKKGASDIGNMSLSNAEAIYKFSLEVKRSEDIEIHYDKWENYTIINGDVVEEGIKVKVGQEFVWKENTYIITRVENEQWRHRANGLLSEAGKETLIMCGKCRVKTIPKKAGIHYCSECGMGHEIEKDGEHIRINPYPKG